MVMPVWMRYRLEAPTAAIQLGVVIVHSQSKEWKHTKLEANKDLLEGVYLISLCVQ